MLFSKKQRESAERAALPEHAGFVPQPKPMAIQIKVEKESAPLFVKVDKYKELLVILQEMKMFSEGIKKLLSLINEMEAARNDAIKMIRASAQRLEKSILEMDGELLRPKGIDLEISQSDMEMRHIESSMSELQGQLLTLKKELEGMR